ncbi:MAG: alpha/beta hydrolase [Methylobacterium sp.]|uniref:alpha/beta fold hydrolase n=1 Tax=Methylobacterium sp. TaxID=409 RepID=UPI0025EAE894|nr:alpha/beta hydrolase [Methylobacterium sp.]MBX9931863.1 alpha/beta hydrolase [Methylobacterium sp.]
MPIVHGLGLLLAGLLALIASTVGAAALATLIIHLRVSERFPPQGQFVDVSGGRLATIEAGPNPSARGTVVLLHGASANASDPMEGVGRRLAARGFRVVAFDRPGFGWSDRLNGSAMASPAAQGRAIAEAMDRLELGPAIVLGHSWAGALATAIALDRPSQVSGLVLVSPVALPFPREYALPWYWDVALKPPVLWFLTHTIAAPLGLYYLPRVGGTVFRPQAAPTDYVETSRAALVLRPGTMRANIQDLVALPDALAAQSPRYATIQAPTVIVAGDADPVVLTEQQAKPLAQTIPGAKLVVLPGIGHMVQIVSAEALVGEIEALAERIAQPLPASPAER